MVRLFLNALVIGAVLVLGASFAGWVHPAGDSLAVFRLPIALGALAVVLLCGTSRQRMVGSVLVALSIAPIAYAMARPETAGTVVVYQKNLWFRNDQLADLAADVLAQAPDIIMLQEVSDQNLALLDMLRTDYPTQIFCDFTGWSGIAVLSRHPAVTDSEVCTDQRGMAAMQVMLNGQAVWAVSIHLYWPWPHGQAAQRDVLLPLIEDMDGPVIMAGDFNMVPWSYTARALAEAANVQHVGRVAPTLRIRDIPLPIDHVFAPLGGASEIRPRLGSDHYGVLARVALP